MWDAFGTIAFSWESFQRLRGPDHKVLESIARFNAIALSSKGFQRLRGSEQKVLEIIVRLDTVDVP